ncbi:MAG: hypothetical protein EBX50_01345 [Chitinophagia bacterium]|nr:hypothetical protein [Chitinophagia bacterium]
MSIKITMPKWTNLKGFYGSNGSGSAFGSIPIFENETELIASKPENSGVYEVILVSTGTIWQYNNTTKVWFDTLISPDNLGSRVDNLEAGLQAEATDRQNADASLQSDISSISTQVQDIDANVAYKNSAALTYKAIASNTYKKDYFLYDILSGDGGIVINDFIGGPKFSDLVNDGTIQLMPIGSRSAFLINNAPDQNINYNNENGFGVGSEVEYLNDIWVYVEENASGVPTWVLKNSTVPVSRGFDLLDEYAEGAILTVNNAIGLPDANYSTNLTSVFTQSFKANYIIDSSQPFFNVLDLNGNIINSLKLRYLSSAENPIKSDSDLPLETSILNNVTQKDLNNYLAQRGDIIAYKGSTAFAPTINIVDNDISITGSYTRLSNKATISIDVIFSGTLSDNSVFEFDLSSIGGCSNIVGQAYYSDDSKSRIYDGIIVQTTSNKFKIASDGDYWRNGNPVTGVSTGDAIRIDLSCVVVEWSETSPQLTKSLTSANTNLTITETDTDYVFNVSSGGGAKYADSANYWVFKDVTDNPTNCIYNTLQKAHDAFLASGKTLGYIRMGAGAWTETCTISATNLHIEGVGNGTRSQTQQNGKVTITGHRVTLKNILFGNASTSPPVEINCPGTLTENGVPNIGRGKVVFDNCSFSTATNISPMTITALNNWATFTMCDFGGKGALTLPNNASQVNWYYLFASCSNVGLIRGNFTICAIDSNSVSVVDVSASASSTAFRGNQLVTWVLGTPVFKGHFYYYNSVLYLAKNTVSSSITAPNLDTTNFQLAFNNNAALFTNFTLGMAVTAGSLYKQDNGYYMARNSVTANSYPSVDVTNFSFFSHPSGVIVGQKFVWTQPLSLLPTDISSDCVIADGSTISSLTLTADQKASLTTRLSGSANIPDWRGLFARSIDNRTSGNRDSSGVRTPNNYQSDQIISHNHAQFFWYAYEAISGGNVPLVSNSSIGSYGNSGYLYSNNFGGTETNPKNYAEFHLIRIK